MGGDVKVMGTGMMAKLSLTVAMPMLEESIDREPVFRRSHEVCTRTK
jgi:S-adenosylmethionine synthetase